MKTFFQDSFKELRHVQWPTPNETKDYFKVVVSFIAVFAVFIFISGTVFSTSLFFAREHLGLSQKTTTTASGTTSPINLQDIKLGSGVTVTPAAKTTSGATK